MSYLVNLTFAFFCHLDLTDFSGGASASADAWIEATDAKGKDVTYFSGVVSVGGTYELNDNRERFEADMFVKTYTVVNGGKGTIRQTVKYHR